MCLVQIVSEDSGWRREEHLQSSRRDEHPLTCVVLIVLRYGVPVNLTSIYEELLINHGCLMPKPSTEIMRGIFLAPRNFHEENQNGN